MDTNRFHRSLLTFRLLALLGGLLLVIGLGLRFTGLLISATLAMALAGGVGLLIGLAGSITLQISKPKSIR